MEWENVAQALTIPVFSGGGGMFAGEEGGLAMLDERVIQHGKALVFTVGTALGCALADPLAAARHFMAAGTQA